LVYLPSSSTQGDELAPLLVLLSILDPRQVPRAKARRQANLSPLVEDGVGGGRDRGRRGTKGAILFVVVTAIATAGSGSGRDGRDGSGRGVTLLEGLRAPPNGSCRGGNFRTRGPPIERICQESRSVRLKQDFISNDCRMLPRTVHANEPSATHGR
jgi:hypothetical protein